MKIEQKLSDTDFKLQFQQSPARGKWKMGSKIKFLYVMLSNYLLFCFRSQ